MKTKEKRVITVQTRIFAPIADVWKCWTTPADIVKWNHASDDWHTTRAENNLRVGGTFKSKMEAKNGSMGFDFSGVYRKITPFRLIEYKMDDGREVVIQFSAKKQQTEIVETFEAEEIHSVELQRKGWQAILDNFKKYAEAEKQNAGAIE